MKKHLFLLFALCFSIGTMAEDIPANYYDAINGKQDSALKSTLHEIIKGGERYEYGSNNYHSTSNPPQWEKGDLKSYGTWQAFPITDVGDYNVILDMYSKSVRYFPNKRGDSGCGLQIEHCLPKSWWGSEKASKAAYCDLWNLNPADAQANGQKSNFPPGYVTKADKFDNGSFRMDKKSQYGDKSFSCFEPEDQYKGDFARAYFYIATAYEDVAWVNDYAKYVTNDSWEEFVPWLKDVLLDWHRKDPVSRKEIERADYISSIQHNRNPYIDYPDLIEYIWGNKQGEAVDLEHLTCYADNQHTPIVLPDPDPRVYDTIVNLPGLTKAIVNAYVNGEVTGYASDKIQSNGSSAILMGASSTDGYISFSNLSLSDTAVLAFRASPYQTASSMQIDIYTDDQLLTSIEETVEQYTRYEKRYRITIPAGTRSIKIASVGGSTSKRACIQELYLLGPQKAEGVCNISIDNEPARKEIREGQIVIIRNSSVFSILGQPIQ